MGNHHADISGFALKVVAIAGMACNHAAYVFALHLPSALTIALFSCGGLTFPIMSFLLAEGYRHTSNVKRYALRLLAFALLSQIPFTFLWGATANVLFTLLIGLCLLHAYDRMSSRVAFAAAFVAALALSSFCDWGVIGPLMVFMFHVLHGHGTRGTWMAMLVPLCALGLPSALSLAVVWSSQEEALLHLLAILASSASGADVVGIDLSSVASAAGGLPQFGPLVLAGESFSLCDPLVVAISQAGYCLAGIGVAALLMACYRGRRGRPLKWFFYIFYPASLFGLWLLWLVVA